MASKATKTVEHAVAASSLIDTILKYIPVEILAPIVFNAVLATIKNPSSVSAKALKKVLIPFGQALVQKYPEICG